MKISGHMDLCGPDLIEGWLYSDAWDGDPIKLQVFVDDNLIGECIADQFRADLQDAGCRVRGRALWLQFRDRLFECETETYR
jgi:hypothetical protein